MYDIFFLSYDEPNADENWRLLKDRFSRAKRIHGISGILNAHKECARKSLTKMFYVVDGDNVIAEDFKFSFKPTKWDVDVVHVWRSSNPVNGLEYGYGGVKLLPKKVVLDLPDMQTDMTTSLSTKFKAVEEVASITYFNSSAFNAWRGAFRECTKLAAKVIDRQKSDETENRLNVWCSINNNAEYGDYALEGAKQGREYGSTHKNDTEALKKINDFKWLEEQFNGD